MTKLTGLIGYPVSHSLSPRIHAYWIAKHGLDAEYKLFTTSPARLRQTMLHMRKKNIAGVNITVPHKQAVLEYLDAVDVIGTRLGAVNTVTNKNGKFTGTNTDAYGFITNLREGLGELAPYLDHVVILGAGGATRAVIAALQEVGAKTVTITNRTLKTTQALAKEFGAGAEPWEERNNVIGKASLLVNTTSLGMVDHPPLEIDLESLPDNAAVHDIVYAPLETELLKEARLRGHRIVDGLGMLLYQAQLAFKEWHGILPEVTPELRTHVLAPNPDDEHAA
jgi:shikimate dehydrogenase